MAQSLWARLRERDPDPSVLSSADEVKRVRPPRVSRPTSLPGLSPRPRLSARVGTRERTRTRRTSLTRSLPASRRAVDRHRERVRARVEGDRREAQVRRDTHARGGGRRHRRDLRGIQPGRRVRRARARARKRRDVESGERSRKSRNTRSTFSGGFVHVSRREGAGVQRRRAGDAFRRATRRASARAAAAQLQALDGASAVARQDARRRSRPGRVSSFENRRWSRGDGRVGR